jgi:hypothetical protein
MLRNFSQVALPPFRLITTVAMFGLIAIEIAQAASIVYVGEDAGVVGVFGRDYQYVNIPDSVGGTPGASWFSVGFDHSGWSVGETQFGNTGGFGSSITRTPWAANTDMYVFRTFTLGQPIDMVAKTAVDNGYDLYINDVLVTSKNAEGFTFHWEYTDILDASLFQAGTNSIGIHLEDHGGGTAWDFALIGDDSGLTAIPEPSTVLLFIIGVMGTAIYGWQRWRKTV